MANEPQVVASPTQGTQTPAPVTITANEPTPSNTGQASTSALAQGQNVSKEAQVSTTEPKPVQRNDNAEAAKYAYLESENAKLKKEVEARKDYDDLKKKAQDFEAINSHYSTDRAAYESLRQSWIKAGKGDPGAYEQVYAQAQAQQQQNNGSVPAPVAQPQMQEVVQAAVGELELRTGIDKWLDANKEMDYRDLSPESDEYKNREAKAVKVARSAAALRMVDPSLNIKSALDKALRLDDDYYNQQLKSETDIARRTGQANAFAKASASMGNITGDAGSQGQVQIQLSPEQQKLYDRYLAKGESKRAESYAKEIYRRSQQ